MKKLIFFLTLSIATLPYTYGQYVELKESADEGFVSNEGVNIHYLSWGEGPLVVMLHGFPDFWYSWRAIISGLATDYKVVAVDLRGYNLSDRPEGVENYTMSILMKDILKVIDHFEEEQAILVGNDWGGAIAWNLALYYPQRIKRLVACNIPYPSNISKYLRDHPAVGEYAKKFQEGNVPSINSLVKVVPDSSQWEYYTQAFQRSDLEAMLNYYRVSYPNSSKIQTPTSKPSASASGAKVRCPVLMTYGLQDSALPPGMINDTWDYVDNELTIYTLPQGGHFIQQEEPEKTLKAIKSWLGN